MTREELIHMADASGLSYYGIGKNRERFIAHLQRFADIVAEGAAFAEREVCAKVCDGNADIEHWQDEKSGGTRTGLHAKLIRARTSQQPKGGMNE